MMRMSFVSKHFPDNKNEIFSNSRDSKINRDGYFCNLYILRTELLSFGINLSTEDIISPEEADVLLYEGVSDDRRLNKISYTWCLESDIVRPEDFVVNNHKEFTKVFTWSDELVKFNPTKYIKTNYSFCFPENVKIGMVGRTKLCALIAGNKFSLKDKELYSKRLEAIEWFEKKHIDDFDLYGIYWDQFYSKSKIKLFRVINRLNFLRKLIKPIPRPSYKGLVETKKDVLEKYKFSICYENASADGYITEKIFDCFFAGCVPIYLGAPNILDYIPANCFIDRRNFNSYELLYEYMINMSEKDYIGYQIAISEFLKSPMGYEFSAERTAEIFLEELRNDRILNV